MNTPLHRTAALHPSRGAWRAAALALVCLSQITSAHAWTLSLASASRRVFLHVGNGTYDGNNGTVNTVSSTLTSAQLIGGNPQAMTTNSTQSRSLYDGYSTCPNPASQILIGASYRRNNGRDGPARATLRVTSPANLVNDNSDTIPFSQISWSVSASGSAQSNVIAAGAFNGGSLTLASIRANTYIENCHSFVYANETVRAAGTYTGQVTYTLSSP
ncbi:hypothetical protein [Hydrogenophaga sp. PAMC20947]|uniref:hypothetical protein n=1 Tax=Hydrogenophaga sp. PAMC20947 TaxID=2565558 RepID=UPI00109E2FA2|nr:hypothetical protein [Hydrogenophaga sp. PAMC20947]QCB47797.1 hypothetical protein E5678_18230 [Hydrogenophaga sp. PAMC20947]